MKLQEYLGQLSKKRVTVIGIGVSNTPLIQMLCKFGIHVTACDRKERDALGNIAEELEKAGVCLQLGEHYLDHLAADVIFRTPGLHPQHPRLQEAKANGSQILSEMELFLRFCPCTTIGITGSDGKTTTASIIAEMLKMAGKTVHLGGNIGSPLLSALPTMQPQDYAVLELSSFQLLDMPYSPHIAVITNLSPNHLDVHRDMQEYIDAKKNIYRHQTADDIAIFNLDNAVTRAFGAKAHGSVKYFSQNETMADGACVHDGHICLYNGGMRRTVMPLSAIRLPGRHNVENYLAAVAALDGIVQRSVMEETAREFSGVEHRIEFVRECRGVRYYNDSIASSPSRTIAGLRSFDQKVILIAGGYDKHIPFTALAEEIAARVSLLILCGDTSDQIYDAVLNCPAYRAESEMPRIIRCADLQEAVKCAAANAKRGDVVTLSPACAAFDQFKDFVERGRTYKELVHNLSE